MRTGAKLLVPWVAALCATLSAQPTDPKPTPMPPAAQAAPKKPAVKKGPSAPKRPPAIKITAATSDGVVTGKTTDPSFMVRLTVSKEGGEVNTEPAWAEQSGDFTIPLLLLKPGWIVQAWVVDGGNALAHSVPVVVSLSEEDAAEQETAALSPQPKPQPAASTPLPARRNPPVPATARKPAAKPVAPVPTGPCDVGNLDTTSDLRLADGDSQIKGSTFKFGSGSVSVCVNGKPRLIHDTSDPTSVGGTLKGNKFDVTLTTDSKLEQGNYVLALLEADNGDRAAVQTTVGASKQITASACDMEDPGNQKIYPDGLRSGGSEITATLPETSGTVTVCVNDLQAEIALGPGPAKATTKYVTTLDVSDAKIDLLIKVPVLRDQLVRIAWLSKDGNRRVTKDLTVQAPKLSAVVLPSVPKEGDTKILVNTESSGTDNPLSLSVYVNQDRVPLLDSKGSEVGYLPADSSGETGLTLKSPVDGGDCVVVVEFPTGKQPLDLDFNKLICDARNKVPRTPIPSLGYWQSYPLLANSLFNWGRVRGYMAAGGLFSFDNANFSQQSIFLGFNMTKNWLWGGPFWRIDPDLNLPVRSYRRTMFETFFDVRLTSLPVASCTAASTTTTGSSPAPSPQGSAGGAAATTTQGSSAGSAPACPNTVDAFVATRKSAVLNGGVSLPFIVADWRYGHRPYAMSIGPLAKIGFDTPVGDVQSGSVAANQHAFYTNYGFGGRLGLYRMSYSTNVAPELESYVDIVSGRYSNFDVTTPVGIRYARPWRIGIEGVLKVPTTPFIIGFGANVHQNFGLGNSKTVNNARDSLQFLFGAKFDAGKLFKKIGTIQ